MFEIKSGDLFGDKSDALVNAVNCQGSMDGGIARQFRIRFPEYFRDYADSCGRGEIRLGEVDLYEIGNSMPPFYIISFPTMFFPAAMARIEDIDSGLSDLRRKIENRRIRSIAMPALGCGVGGLEWAAVRKSIEAALSGMRGLHVSLYEPR
ncbi:MAG: macro domain-containing protein [Albidovulum sp.]|nr:macro domain-containing protein [Albidovulum sp.]